MRSIARPRLRDDIVRELAELIAAGELDSSLRLKEVEIAERLGVSRTPLREALLVLERDGLVVSEVNKGFRVAAVSEARVRELYPILGALEALAVRDGIAALQPRAGELRAINGQLKLARTNAKRHALDHRFHELLWAGSHNAALVQMLRTLWLQAQQVDGASTRGMANLEGSMRDHAAIAVAIGRGDADTAARRLEAHWRDGIEVVAGWLRRAAPVVAMALVVATATTVRADATLTRATCPVPAAAGQAIECFTLTVPERRPASGNRTVGIPIVRFRSRSPHPGEPLVILVGGPGGSAIHARLDGAQNPYLDDRDVILFEQRGTRFATPELACPNWDAAVKVIERDNLAGAAAIAKRRAAAIECAAQLRATGVDLDAYDTVAIVDDLLDLQHALGAGPLDLFGISYGTRIALEAIRVAPAAFHAIVLDSVLPPDVRYDELATDNVLAALDRVLDQCAVDPHCTATYPDLRTRWLAALAHATAPNARHLIEAVYDALNSHVAIHAIPKLVDSIARGDLAPVTKILADNAGSSGATRGERLSVWCRDEASVTDLARASHHPELGGWETIAVDPDVCRAWHVTASAMPKTPVASDVPALIFAGEYDPNTPPAWGRHARDTLANGLFVEIPGETHAAGDGACAVSIARAFLRAPKLTPDLTCVARAPAPSFQ